MKKLFLLLSILMGAGCFTYVSAQDVEEYIRQAKENAVVFRGPTPIKYPFRFNGSFYAFEDKFVPGELWYNHKYYKNVLLNLNANRDELYIKVYNSATMVVLDKNLVEKFTLGDKTFLNVSAKYPVGNMAPGYYQILYKGKDQLFKKIEKRYYERVGLTDQNGVFRSFEGYYTYIILKDGIAYPFSQAGAFSKIYKGKKNEIKKFRKVNNMKFIEVGRQDDSFKSIMQFIDENE